MQRPETVEWLRIRQLFERGGCAAIPVFIILAVIAIIEQLITKDSKIARKVGVSLNLDDNLFYSKNLHPIRETKLNQLINEYYEYANVFADKFTSEDIPSEILDSFYKLERRVLEMANRGELRQAINVVQAWFHDLENSEAGKTVISRTHSDSSGTTCTVSYLLHSDIYGLLSRLYEMVPSSDWIVSDPAYFYFEALDYLIRSTTSNVFGSLDLSELHKKILELLKKAGFDEAVRRLTPNQSGPYQPIIEPNSN